MIQKIFIPNLARRVDRKHMNYGALLSRHVPSDVLLYFPAKDGQDYHSTTAMIRRAKHEGIPIQAEHEQMEAWGITKSYFGWQWTWAAMLQHIINFNEPNALYMILIDDFFLETDLSTIEYALHEIQYDDFKICDKHPHAALIVQFHWVNFQDYPPLERQSMMNTTHKIFRGIKGAGDQATVLNAAGASILLRLWSTCPHEPTERHFWYLAKEQEQHGFYSMGYPHEWVHPYNPDDVSDDREPSNANS